MSNGLDPDQDRRSVGPDLTPNCLQRLLVAASKKKVESSCAKTYRNIRTGRTAATEQDDISHS